MEYPMLLQIISILIIDLDNWILNIVVTTIDFNKYVSNNLILE